MSSSNRARPRGAIARWLAAAAGEYQDQRHAPQRSDKEPDQQYRASVGGMNVVDDQADGSAGAGTTQLLGDRDKRANLSRSHSAVPQVGGQQVGHRVAAQFTQDRLPWPQCRSPTIDPAAGADDVEAGTICERRDLITEPCLSDAGLTGDNNKRSPALGGGGEQRLYEAKLTPSTHEPLRRCQNTLDHCATVRAGLQITSSPGLGRTLPCQRPRLQKRGRRPPFAQTCFVGTARIAHKRTASMACSFTIPPRSPSPSSFTTEDRPIRVETQVPVSPTVDTVLATVAGRRDLV